MVEMTVPMPEELRDRFSSMTPWFPTVVELICLDFETNALKAAGEVIRFLATGPSESEVLAYHASEQAQARLELKGRAGLEIQ